MNRDPIQNEVKQSVLERNENRSLYLELLLLHSNQMRHGVVKLWPTAPTSIGFVTTAREEEPV
jgi:hypothetical protein